MLLIVELYVHDVVANISKTEKVQTHLTDCWSHFLQKSISNNCADILNTTLAKQLLTLPSAYDKNVDGHR
jgi:hypothetical protein